MPKIKAAIVGPGNIGLDLLYKLKRSKFIELDTVVGIISSSQGLELAKKEGYKTTHEGVEAILDDPDIKIVFDATGARPHLHNAPLLKAAGKIAIDLTPAAVGPYVVPCVNLDKHIDEPNINMVTCGGQATIPIVAAISRAAHVYYAEIVATIASKSAGPGTRQNIDEFTQTTARGIEIIGGADKGKAIIILNPAEPPLMMRNTVYARVGENADKAAIEKSINEMVADVQKYVPGYHLRVPPIFDGDRVMTIVEVEGAGDYLPKYSGNLDIMTAASVMAADRIAQKLLAQ